tara:strand:- start:888 stop:1973 length:1086 start_codon:yes stop_codon:yes gene_type:complete
MLPSLGRDSNPSIMYLQAFGEVLTDALTVNPILVDIPSASAILDASNYTFQAVTLGKDAQGFNKHSHTVSGDLVAGVANDGVLLVYSQETNGASSYSVANTHSVLSATYASSLPNSPWITDSRLERGNTRHLEIGSSQDLGHYANVAISNSFAEVGQAAPSATWNVVGGYAPSGAVHDYLFLDMDGSGMFSGTLSGYYNTYGIVDVDGYITVNPTGRANDDLDAYNEGSYVVSGAGLQPGGLFLKTRLMRGDAACLAAFGGVNHIGIYCLDLKAMLAGGLTPPYTFSALNNPRSYKLVAKVTTVDNMLKHTDCDATAALGGYHSGFEHILNTNADVSPLAPGVAFFDTNDGQVLSCFFQLQ